MSLKPLQLLGWPRGLEIFTRTPLAPTVPKNQPLRNSEGTAKAPRGLSTAQNTAQVLLLLLTLVIAPAQAQDGIHVAGDSISALPGTWPELLAADGWRIFNTSMSTRRAVDYEVPPDLLPWDAKRAVLALGTNDGLTGEPMEWFKIKYRQIASTFLGRGFGLVMVAPPTLEGTAEQNAYALELCNGLRWFNSQVRCVNPDNLNYADHTTDGVHPDSYMSGQLADAIGEALGELEQ